MRLLCVLIGITISLYMYWEELGNNITSHRYNFQYLYKLMKVNWFTRDFNRDHLCIVFVGDIISKIQNL